MVKKPVSCRAICQHDHATPLLLPPDLRDWASPDHMVHFVKGAVAAVDPSAAHVNGGLGSLPTGRLAQLPNWKWR
jgi:hypothetical protein